jgi:serine protease AprX
MDRPTRCWGFQLTTNSGYLFAMREVGGTTGAKRAPLGWRIVGAGLTAAITVTAAAAAGPVSAGPAAALGLLPTASLLAPEPQETSVTADADAEAETEADAGAPSASASASASVNVAGIIKAGWDDGATTAPTSMSLIAESIGADDLWAQGIDGTGVGVAIVDSGVAPVPAMSTPGKVVNGPDLSFESQATAYRYLDTFGHGTHMAGIVAGRDATTGYKGVAPGAHIVNVKVANYQGAVDVSQVIAAIDWVVQHRNDPGMNIRVLSLAYGTDAITDYKTDPLAHAVESAWRKGIVVVVSGGNDGADRPALTNPAIDPYVIAVGADDLRGTATAADDKVAPFSSRGSSTRAVDVVAPGVSITSLRAPGSTIDDEHASARVGEALFRGSGTSQAAAVTAGAAALLLQAKPGLTPDAVKALLRTTATPIVNDDARAQGAGRIDVSAASLAPLPLLAAQTWAPSTGLGSIERARGTSHVAQDGIELTGEQDIMGMPWSGAVWAPQASAGAAWDDGRWNGTEWTGACWCGSSWTSSTWQGKSWTGKSWTGKSWTADDWSGKSWTGKSWTGDSWTGKSWTGKSWTGKSWTTPA